jgi:excisionase family DNA binding protein
MIRMKAEYCILQWAQEGIDLDRSRAKRRGRVAQIVQFSVSHYINIAKPGVAIPDFSYNGEFMSISHYSPEVVAAELGVTATHVRRLIKRGVISATRLPPRGRYRIPRGEAVRLRALLVVTP